MTSPNSETMSHYAARVSLPVSAAEAFAYHERPGALSRLVPPWESVTLEHSDGSLAPGSQVVLKTKIAGIPFRWIAEHTEYDPPRLFADRQIQGPFAHWEHRHEFSGDAASEHESELTDRIAYQLPMGRLGRTFGRGLALKTIERMFAYRHRITRDDLQLAADYPMEPMTVAVSGASGMVGQSFTSLMTLLGHQVRPIVRSETELPEEIAAWSSESEAAKLDEVDAVVHLAGKSIASSRWTDGVKEEIRDSRVIKTHELCEKLAALPNPPKTLVCASATGIYGDAGEAVLEENSPPDDSFLAEVATEWEAACQPAVDAGIRVVHARFSMILSPTGGALQKSLLPAKFMGGALGGGKQWWSWISLDDAVGALYFSLANAQATGPINFVSPEPIRNKDFARTLGRVLGRPALFPAPAFGLRLALGEMADALLLSSTRAVPGKLNELGYPFRFTDLESFLRYSLGRERIASIGSSEEP